ncbi:MAG: hypothetical protein AB1791_05410 [Chloroflexota bacterium]
MKRTNLVRLFLVLELLVALTLVTRPAAAHTGEDAQLQVLNAPAGPYSVTVWSYPGRLYAGAIHFTVAVADTKDGRPVLGSNVKLEITPVQGPGSPIVVEALNGPANPAASSDPSAAFLYEADTKLMEKGDYNIRVLVNNRATGLGAADFQVEVVSATAYKWVVSVLFVQAMATAVWLVKEGITTWSKPFSWKLNPGVLASQRSAAAR